jgi:hypothetical protein
MDHDQNVSINVYKLDDVQFASLLPLLSRLVALLEDKAAAVALTAKLKTSEEKLASAVASGQPKP